MKIESITITDNSGLKRLKAVITYNDGTKKGVTFGMKDSKGTFADGASEQKRDAYIARHSKLDENWRDPTTAGYMSKWVLWSFRENKQIEKFLKKDTGAKNVSVNFKRYKVI
jgi:hypothetical protein